MLLHIASDNYFLVIPMGKAAPAATNISGTDFKTLEGFEKRNLTKAARTGAGSARCSRPLRGEHV